MRTEVVQVSCDLCGRGGPLTVPEDFTQHGAFDLCQWCADTERGAWIETGSHLVTFNETKTDWTCSCGHTYLQMTFAVSRLIPARLVAVVPNLPRALANLHLNDRSANRS